MIHQDVMRWTTCPECLHYHALSARGEAIEVVHRLDGTHAVVELADLADEAASFLRSAS